MKGHNEAHARKVFYALSDAKLAHHERQQREALEPAQRSADGGSFDVEGIVNAELNRTSVAAKQTGIGIVPPWRVDPSGPSAPRRWAAEPAGERPYGLRPYELKWMQAIASIVVAPRLSDDRYNSQRLRDFRAHIHEQACRSGAAFENAGRPPSIEGLCQYIISDMVNREIPWTWKEVESREQRLGHFPSRAYAHGIRWLEKEGIELYRRHDQLRWCIDSPGADADNSKLPDWIKQYRQQAECIRARGRDSMVATDEGFEFQDVSNTVARRRERQGIQLRERRKPGPKGTYDGRGGTGAERARRYYAKKKSKAIINPNDRDRPDIVEAPIAPGAISMVSGTLSTDKESAMANDVVEMSEYKQRRVLRDLRSKSPQYMWVPIESLVQISKLADEILRGAHDDPTKES